MTSRDEREALVNTLRQITSGERKEFCYVQITIEFADRLIAALTAPQLAQTELEQIHEICLNVAECPPVAESDTATVRYVKDMAHLINLLSAPKSDAEPVAITNGMAHAFHAAIADGALGESEVEEIKTGLRAAFANVTAPTNPAADRGEAVAWHYEFIGHKNPGGYPADHARVRRDDLGSEWRIHPLAFASSAPSHEGVVVPREPTEEMIDAAVEWRNTIQVVNADATMRNQFAECYRAMLAAAPAAAKEKS